MRHRAFTLVELLVTIVIIGMLAMMSMAALHAVQGAARVSRTQATIAKINTYVSEQYESYRGRRLPFNPTSSTYAPVPWIYDPTDPETDPAKKRRIYFTATEVAGRRLNMLRDLMRLEMPDRWSDVTDPANPVAVRLLLLPRAPAMAEAYRRRYQQAVARSSAGTVANNAAAKCLYMVVMTNNPEAREHFREDEIDRPDADGLPVFVDGWGRPIRWLRWPAGFSSYAALTVHNSGVGPAGEAGGKRWDWGDASDVQSGDSSANYDPWDTSKVFEQLVARGLTSPPSSLPSVPRDRRGFVMLPLIYSAGQDGIYDINIGRTSSAGLYQVALTPERDLNPFGPDGYHAPDAVATSTYNRFAGQPIDSDLDEHLHHYDNITNHRNAVK